MEKSLYQSNKWGRYDIKMITICRNEVILQQQQEGSPYNQLFSPSTEGEAGKEGQKHYVELHVKKFPSSAINKLRRRFYRMGESDLKVISDYYVEPLVENPNSAGTVHVQQELDGFLGARYQRSLLVLGDSGEGKSTLAYHIVWRLWRDFKPGDRVPVLIYLAFTPAEKRDKSLLQTSLEEADLTSSEIASFIANYPLLVVLDGYDEIPNMTNLYKLNGWSRYSVKMITTCRHEALLQMQKGSSYKQLFLPDVKKDEGKKPEECYVELHLKRFNSAQIDQYLQQYLQSSHQADSPSQLLTKDWEEYRKYIDAIPGLIDLIATPFILSMIMTSNMLPKLLQDY